MLVFDQCIESTNLPDAMSADQAVADCPTNVALM